MFQKVLFCVTVIYSAYAIPIDTGYGGFANYGGFHGGAAFAAAPIAVQHVQPAIVKQLVAAEPVNPNPNYSFSYGVNDPHTGDAKEAQEVLENGVVHGSYSLAEPDGSIRKVTYTADDHNGFNAVVEKIGGAKAVAVAPVAKIFAQPAYAAPALSKTIAYAAPAYAAPTYSKYLSGGFIH